MKNAIAFTLASLFALATGCANAASDHPVHWSYTGKTDAAHWAALDAANSACKLSRQQSPINIDTRHLTRAALAPLEFSYATGAAEVVNNGHTVQVNLPAGGILHAGDETTKLLQFHFHTPSEETINGKHYPMVAHFVHKADDGMLSVVAVLFKEGKENATLAPVFAAMPAQGEAAALASFDPSTLLPQNHAYYKFTGSLTTPPCSDGVHWQVMKNPVELSKQQIAAFRKLYPMNARPVQKLNGRHVLVGR